MTNEDDSINLNPAELQLSTIYHLPNCFRYHSYRAQAYSITRFNVINPQSSVCYSIIDTQDSSLSTPQTFKYVAF